MLKSAAEEDLVMACRAATCGERMPRGVLTHGEDEVVTLIAEGQTSREFAGILVLSVKTAERHRADVLAKLGMRDRTELTRYAIRAGLIEP